MAQDTPPLPDSPMKRMYPAPAKSGDKVYRKGEYQDIQRGTKLQLDFERGESERRAARTAPARESTFSKVKRGFTTFRSMGRSR